MKKFSNKFLTFNFGPQHPSAHGVLRLITFLEGEKVRYLDPHIGLLHRGTEKLIESKSYVQALPYFDRLDYVSTMSQELTYSLTVEKIFGILVPVRASFLRVLFLELHRILNHLMALTTHALDLGALTPFLWGFEEREKILEFCERVSGARIHSAYIQPGGVDRDISYNLKKDILKFSLYFEKKLSELRNVLSSNLIWKYRLDGIGKISSNFAKNYSLTGVILRSTGVPFDLRAAFPYEVYFNIKNFNILVGLNGDCYDRYLLRFFELFESINIIKFILGNIPKGFIKNINSGFNSSYKKIKFIRMEEVIFHFLKFSQKYASKKKTEHSYTEAPKGAMGVFISSDGTSNPYRCAIRTPGFYNLQSLNSMCYNHLLSDLVTVIGTQDLVFGEIDR